MINSGVKVTIALTGASADLLKPIQYGILLSEDDSLNDAKLLMSDIEEHLIASFQEMGFFL